MVVNKSTVTSAVQTQGKGGQVLPDYIKYFKSLPAIS